MVNAYAGIASKFGKNESTAELTVVVVLYQNSGYRGAGSVPRVLQITRKHRRRGIAYAATVIGATANQHVSIDTPLRETERRTNGQQPSGSHLVSRMMVLGEHGIGNNASGKTGHRCVDRL